MQRFLLPEQYTNSSVVSTNNPFGRPCYVSADFQHAHLTSQSFCCWFPICSQPQSCWFAEEDGVSAGQEEVTLFMEDTAFMQGAVGLTLMPSHPSTTLPLSDLAQMARLVLGTDKLFGFFLSVRLSTASMSTITTCAVVTAACHRCCCLHTLLV